MLTTALRLLATLLAVAAIATALWQLERFRAGLTITHAQVDGTPVSVYHRNDVETAPAVILTHGFAGSRQLMEAYALTLARAGYVAVSFDFHGHGRNPQPMSGDVTQLDGTTRRLMAQIGQITDFTLSLPETNGALALLGHSMASDIIVRQARQDPRIKAVIAISMFSQAVTEAQPANLLVITGEWETFLRAEALKAARLSNAQAVEGRTIGGLAAGTARRVVVAPNVEHVGVLYSPTGLREARAWLDRVFKGPHAPASASASASAASAPATAEPVSPTVVTSPSIAPMSVATTGPWIVLLLLGIVALAWPATALLPQHTGTGAATGKGTGTDIGVAIDTGRPPEATPIGPFLVAALLPAILTPLVLAPFDTRFLPVLVADYLAAHLFVFAAIALLVLWRAGVHSNRAAVHISPLSRNLSGHLSGLVIGLALAAYGIGVFGGALDRYVASFMPNEPRIPIILAMAVGAIPFMIADCLLTGAGRGPVWRTLLARAAFLASLGLAVALNTERLFFLLIILPVIVVFYFVFGTMAGWVVRRTGSALAAGLGMGLTLAWALGVTFPLFARI